MTTCVMMPLRSSLRDSPCGHAFAQQCPARTAQNDTSCSVHILLIDIAAAQKMLCAPQVPDEEKRRRADYIINTVRCTVFV